MLNYFSFEQNPLTIFETSSHSSKTLSPKFRFSTRNFCFSSLLVALDAGKNNSQSVSV